MPSTLRDLFSSATPLSITLAGLASSTGGVGRQSAMVDNSAARHGDVLLFLRVKQGPSPVGGRAVYVYLLRGDRHGSAPHRSDDAGAADAALTVRNARLLGVLSNSVAPAGGEVLRGEFLIHRPGPEWGVAVVHDTGAALDADPAAHAVRYVGLHQEVD